MKTTYHHGDLRQAALREALAMLDERSGERISIRTLAQRVGVSHGSLYRHFEGLDDLNGEVTAECFRALVRRFERAADARADEPTGAVAVMCEVYFAYAEDYPSRYELMFDRNTPMQSHAGAFAVAEQAFALLAASVARAGLPEPEPKAFLIWAQLHGTVEILKHAALPIGLNAHRDMLKAQTIRACIDVLARAER